MIERRLYHVCDDPVHQAQVEQWVAELRGEVTDDPRRMSACLVDLDFLPLGLQVADLLKELSRYPRCPTAIHGFNIRDEDREWFASHGIMTFTRMSRTRLAKLFA